MSRRIRCLDGLRATAILMVLLGHSVYGLPPLLTGLIGALEVSHVGVSVFFVLSGYLITRLLVEERERQGAISLKAFYIRRFFRILPPYFVYLTCLLILDRHGYVTVPRSGVLPAYLFVWNYSPQAEGWFYSHSWSLSMEEQFYLLWPPLLILLGQIRATRFAAGIVLLAPLSRLATYVLLPAYRGKIGGMLHTHGDALMFGAIPALMDGQQAFERKLSWLFARKGHIAAALALVVSTLIGHVLRGGYNLPVGLSIEGLCISILLIWLVRNPGSFADKVLNTRPMIFIGSISYSLYLWQQLFIGLKPPLPVALVLATCAAVASYRLIETPALNLRDLVLARLRREPSTERVSSPRG